MLHIRFKNGAELSVTTNVVMVTISLIVVCICSYIRVADASSYKSLIASFITLCVLFAMLRHIFRLLRNKEEYRYLRDSVKDEENAIKEKKEKEKFTTAENAKSDTYKMKKFIRETYESWAYEIMSSLEQPMHDAVEHEKNHICVAPYKGCEGYNSILDSLDYTCEKLFPKSTLLHCEYYLNLMRKIAKQYGFKVEKLSCQVEISW
jgi:hypothetical protein